MVGAVADIGIYKEGNFYLTYGTENFDIDQIWNSNPEMLGYQIRNECLDKNFSEVVLYRTEIDGRSANLIHDAEKGILKALGSRAKKYKKSLKFSLADKPFIVDTKEDE